MSVSVDGSDDGDSDRSGSGPGSGDGPTEAGDDASPSSVVEVSVRGARAGEEVSVDVSPPSVEDDSVAFDGISATVTRTGDFTMRVTNSRDPLPGSPSFEPEDAAQPLGHVRLDHSIPDEAVEDVTVRFRVSKERLGATGAMPEDVVLYRYADGGWTALETHPVGESAGHYVLVAESPGFSEFAVGARRPSFETFWAEVGSERVSVGDEVAVRARVSNEGAADGVFEASLLVDGTVVSTRHVTVASGGTRQVNFERAFGAPGTYAVAVEGEPAGAVTVEALPGGGEPVRLPGSFFRGVDEFFDLGRLLGTTDRGPWSP